MSWSPSEEGTRNAFYFVCGFELVVIDAEGFPETFLDPGGLLVGHQLGGRNKDLFADKPGHGAKGNEQKCQDDGRN